MPLCPVCRRPWVVVGREGGGMPPISLAPRSARYLSCAEREEIAILRAQGAGVRDIARRLRRAPSTVSRELRRNRRLGAAVWPGVDRSGTAPDVPSARR